MSEVKKTPLFSLHEQYGGKIIDFAGWALPVEYEGITAEHEAVRGAAGLFDVSHMGEVEVKGPQALAYVQNLITNDVTRIEDGQILYTLMCYPDGGVVDDLLVYRYDQEHFFLVINAGNIDQDFNWMLEQRGTYQAELTNVSAEWAEMAIQGPKAQEILQKLTETDLAEIKFFYFRPNVEIAGVPCLVSRTGYTGEDGFEVYLENHEAEKVWQAIMEAGRWEGIKPAGLGSRDTLRFEAALPLYGNELSPEITPLEAGLGMFVKLDKADFIGKDALVKQKEAGLSRKLVGFELLDKGIPRHGYEVMADGKQIGIVTTGYLSPTLKKPIGLALIDIDYSPLDTPIQIQVRKRILPAKVISKSFYKKNYKK